MADPRFPSQWREAVTRCFDKGLYAQFEESYKRNAASAVCATLAPLVAAQQRVLVEALEFYAQLQQGADGGMHAREALASLEAAPVETGSRESDIAAALAELVELKDGPRDADYEARKPLAWERARAALAAPKAGPESGAHGACHGSAKPDANPGTYYEFVAQGVVQADSHEEADEFIGSWVDLAVDSAISVTGWNSCEFVADPTAPTGEGGDTDG